MSAFWPQGAPASFYLVVAWEIAPATEFSQTAHVEADVLEVLEGRDFVFIASRVVLVAMNQEAEHLEIYSILTHLASKKWSGKLGFVLSAPLPTPTLWSGYMDLDWAAVNRITGWAAEALPPANG